MKVHITKHSDNTKMENLKSISTSCQMCKRCKARAEIKGTICSHCYADTYLKLRPTLRKALERNTELLTERQLEETEIPKIYDLYFRFESFGDLHNEVQFENYLSIVKANSETTFTIWTKNPDIMHNVFKGNANAKPKNLIIVFSGLWTDKANTIPKEYEYFIDKVFNVWTSETIANENGKAVNCGKRHCMDCRLCYTHNEVKEINELLK